MLIAATLTLALAGVVRWRSSSAPMLLEVAPHRLPADGVSGATLAARAARSRAQVSDATFEIVQGKRLARLEGTRLRAGVLPGKIVIEARAPDYAAVRVTLETLPDAADHARDGMPDALRLDEESDRRAFVQWFTFLAESQYYAERKDLPAEIADCAGLIRFAYREALREHDSRWAGDLNLQHVPGMPPVEKYQYPFTPLGAALFRVRPGPFRLADASGGGFAEFADAQTLMRRNCHLVGPDVRRAAPGDLLFFRQWEQRLPFHAMIFVGPSQWDAGPGPWVVYHTGPVGKAPGEIRRPSLEELLRHPLPQWRPTAGNSNFVGVFRWNILRDRG